MANTAHQAGAEAQLDAPAAGGDNNATLKLDIKEIMLPALNDASVQAFMMSVNDMKKGGCGCAIPSTDIYDVKDWTRRDIDSQFGLVRRDEGYSFERIRGADGNTYACDDRNTCVHRITPQGAVSVYSNGNEAQRMRVPNYPVFDDAGNLYVSDSGEWGKKNGWIWKIAPGGAAEIWDRSASGFTNGMCLAADGKALYVVESSPPLVSRVEIRPDGSAGGRTVVVELPRTVPDGVALDRDGDLYISLYNPNTIYRLSAKGELVTLYDDWEQLMLVAPTNIAFAGDDMKTLVIASLCGWSIHTAPMPVAGLPVRYPKVG